MSEYHEVVNAGFSLSIYLLCYLVLSLVLSLSLSLHHSRSISMLLNQLPLSPFCPLPTPSPIVLHISLYFPFLHFSLLFAPHLPSSLSYLTFIPVVSSLILDECNSQFLQDNCCGSCRAVVTTSTTTVTTMAPACPGDEIPNCGLIQNITAVDICNATDSLRYLLIQSASNLRSCDGWKTLFHMQFHFVAFFLSLLPALLSMVGFMPLHQSKNIYQLYFLG